MGLVEGIKEYPLGSKVAIWVLLFSSLLTFVSASLQTWAQYSTSLNALQTRLDQTAKATLPFLQAAAATTDSVRLEKTLALLLETPDIYNVTFVNSGPGQRHALTLGQPPRGEESISRHYPLTISADGASLKAREQLEAGNAAPGLTLIASLETLRDGVWSGFWRSVILQFLIITCVSVFLLFLFWALISRHLQKMAFYARNLDLDQPTAALKLSRSLQAQDELAEIVSVINRLRIRLLDQLSELRNSERASRFEREEVLEASHNKSRFIANISHELRTPMTNILGYTGLLMDSAKGAEQKEALVAIQESAETLLAILNDMLELSKLESGTLESHPQPLDPRVLIRETIAELSGSADNKALSLESYVDATLPRWVVADAINLKRVLHALLSVVISMNREGQIVLQLQPARIQRPLSAHATQDSLQGLRFSIEDSGPGLSQQAIDTILSDSFDLGSVEQPYEVGVSLKIALAQNLVELLGGHMGAETDEGRGSTFWFEMDVPLVQPEQAAALNRATLAKLNRVLVAEANELSLNATLDLFANEERMNVDIARTGAECLQAISQVEDSGQAYDSFIIDDSLQDTLEPAAADEIVELIKVFKRVPAHRNSPVIVLTHHPRPKLIQTYRAAGASAYLSKHDRDLHLREALLTLWSERDSGQEDGVSFLLSPELAQRTSSGSLKRRLNVLLVEDNEVNRRLVIKMLQKCGCTTEAVENGEQALQLLPTRHFDLVFMDCWMPVLDGYATTREIRKLEGKSANVPIVALTANAFAGEKEKCFEAGMNEFLTKPVRFEEVSELLHRYSNTLPKANN